VTPIEYYCNKGYPVQVLNLWYNMADVVFSSTLGEGFGLSSIEGMACGVPVVFPDNTSLPEILGYGDRGYLVACGDKPENWITYGAYDSSLVRPRINISSAVDALKAVKVLGKDNERTKRALDWAKSMDWENVNKEWVKIFMEASK
jgi:glycosyltransferase involved in cell wall biosynthesis